MKDPNIGLRSWSSPITSRKPTKKTYIGISVCYYSNGDVKAMLKDFNMAASLHNWDAWKTFIYCFPVKLQMHNMFSLFIVHETCEASHKLLERCLLYNISTQLQFQPNMAIMNAHAGQVKKVVVRLQSQAKLQSFCWLKLQVLPVMYHGFTVNFSTNCFHCKTARNCWKTH